MARRAGGLGLHELSLCQAIAESVTRHAQGRAVARVAVRVGYLRQVVPESLMFSWEMVTTGSELEGCALDIEHVEVTVECRSCRATNALDTPILLCPACGEGDVTVLTGEELLVVSLEMVAV